MKRFAVYALTAFLELGGFTASAATLPDEIDSFRQASVLMLDGIKNHDRAALADASEIFSTIDAEEMTDVEVTASSPDALANPLVQFNGEYCDIVRQNDFILVQLDQLDAMRALGSGLSKVSRDIAPGADATLTFEGIDEMAVLLVSATPGALKCDIKVNDSTDVEVTSDPDGISSHAVWDNGSDVLPISVNIRNVSDKPVSFALVML